MERIYTLIDKLYQQKQQAASTAHLLFTVQLLQQELSQFKNKTGTIGTAKVSVTLPGNFSFTEERVLPSFTNAIKTVGPQAEKEIFVLDAVAEKEAKAPTLFAETNEYILNKPALPKTVHHEQQPVVKTEPNPVYSAQQIFSNVFETVAEAPTLTQYAARKEVHHVIGSQKESLNDRLKEERPEVAHRLKETPVKDLRKAVGINDRFVFVKELFRGDEAMYERSIKTINGFNIYSEAEYWMARELRLKLAWLDDNETVKHFYSLVRRRFA